MRRCWWFGNIGFRRKKDTVGSLHFFPFFDSINKPTSWLKYPISRVSILNLPFSQYVKASSTWALLPFFEKSTMGLPAYLV
jgi:hypothetical protein